MLITPEGRVLWSQFWEEFKPTSTQVDQIDHPERYAPHIKWQNAKAVHYAYLADEIKPGEPGRIWAWFEKSFDNEEPRAQAAMVITRKYYAPDELDSPHNRMVYAIRQPDTLWTIHPEIWTPYLKYP